MSYKKYIKNIIDFAEWTTINAISAIDEGNINCWELINYEENKPFSTYSTTELYKIFIKQKNKKLSTIKKGNNYFDSLKKKKFKKNTWYKLIDSNIIYCLYLGRGLGVGFGTLSWREDLTMSIIDLWEIADMREVRDLLIKEAKKRFPDYCGVKSVINETYYYISGEHKYEYLFQNNNIILKPIDSSSSGIVVFKDGKWAERFEENIVITIDKNVSSFISPTTNFRWLQKRIKYQNKMILQQQFIDIHNNLNFEWRDVPIIEDDQNSTNID